MTQSAPHGETREALLKRAEDAKRLAEQETLPNRARIQADPATQWMRLASLKTGTAAPKKRLDWR